jgi:hypothetical protein
MLPMKNGGRRGSRVPGKLAPVNDLRLDGVSPYRFPAFDGLWRSMVFGVRWSLAFDGLWRSMVFGKATLRGAARINIISL